jgi:hypothetical protein
MKPERAGADTASPTVPEILGGPNAADFAMGGGRARRRALRSHRALPGLTRSKAIDYSS